jgi:hypothetical protein
VKSDNLIYKKVFFTITIFLLGILAFQSGQNKDAVGYSVNALSLNTPHDSPGIITNAPAGFADEPFPTTPPDASKITIGEADANGLAQITGAAGAVESNAYVGIVNLNTRSVITTTSDSQGAFSTELYAPPGAWLQVKHGTDYTRFVELWQNASNQAWDGTVGTYTGLPGTILPAALPPMGNGQVQPFFANGAFFDLSTKEWAGWWISGTLQIPPGSNPPGLSVLPGQTVTLTARLRVTAPGFTCSGTPEYPLWGDLHLYYLFDAEGRPKAWDDWFNAFIFTPTGLPIEHEPGGERILLSGGNPFINPTCAGSSSFDSFLQTSFIIPGDLPQGVFAPEISVIGSHPSGIVPLAPVWYDYTEFDSLPILKVGDPATPRLPLTLLTDYPVNGHRGVGSREDAGYYALPTRVVYLPHRTVIPLLDQHSEKPFTYTMEPGSYWVSGTDRRLPNSPHIPLNLPSGELMVEVMRPDDMVDQLGPAPILQSAMRTPTLPDGSELHEGTGSIGDVYHFHTRDQAFNYQFESYGDHTILVNGHVLDIYGNVYLLQGTYDVTVAQVLDLDPAQLPTTPYMQGDAFSPGLHIFPPVPADVFVEVVHLPYSDPAQAVGKTVTGQANRFGYFQPQPGSEFTFELPGEFRVDIAAVYEAPDGTLWMGTTTWGSVVEGQNSMIEAHGRRGMDYKSDTIDDMPPWFFVPDLPPEKVGIEVYYPYISGDVHWGSEVTQVGGDSIHSAITLRDLSGPGQLIYDILRTHFPRSHSLFRTPPLDTSLTGLEKRLEIDEAPLFITTVNGDDPAVNPADIDLWGYFYASSERPDVHVREIIAEDSIGTAYWRFNDTYGYQIGEPADGDHPGDIKWEFGGVVLRVISETNPINQYAIYSSLWVLLPNEDPAARVTPPFQDATGAGINGGPILTIGDEEIDMLFLPKGVRPGDILQLNDVVSFSGHVGPPLDSRVDVTITSPSGKTYSRSWHANKIGWLYDPTFDFHAQEVGRWTVEVLVEHDRPYIGNGVIPQSHNRGTVMGTSGMYEFYVIEPDSPELGILSPMSGFITWPESGIEPITIRGISPPGTTAVHYTIHDKGVVMGQGTLTPDALGRFTLVYDAGALHEIFSMLSLTAHEGRREGLSDEVSIHFLAVGGEQVQATAVTLIGEEVFVRNSITILDYFLPAITR